MKKIAIVGPECTGKTSLAQALAAYYAVPWVPEYAREYCSTLEHPCTEEDELNIFRGQVALEQRMVETAKELVICDTTILTVKVWCEYVFGTCSQEVLEAIANKHYDYYLLTDIDLAWQEDPLRDFPEPEQRVYFMDVWKNELMRLNARFSVVSGLGERRINNAITIVNNILKTG